jgi:hypothetical protein
MLELIRLLGEYHDDIVVAGGWVPALLIPQEKARHVGSIDVDLALNTRLKEKDSWDIYYCVRYYPGGPRALVAACRPHLVNALFKEGLNKIADKFASPEHTGPKSVADFDEVTDSGERERIQRDAYERVHYLLNELGIV